MLLRTETSNGKQSSDAVGPGGERSPSDQPFYPNSPMEIFLATILCAISVIVLAYTMVVLYRCVCTRNYAEWRASWSTERTDEPVAQLVMEAVPMVLDGHCQEIECMVTDGESVVSSCLGGQLKVWDAATGEQLASIDRKIYFGGNPKHSDLSLEADDAMLSDYESGSPPSRDENSISFPSLQKKINTNFSNLKLKPISNTPLDKQTRRSYDFGDHYRQLYLNHEPRELANSVRHRASALGTSSSSTAVNTARWVVNQTSMNLLGGARLHRGVSAGAADLCPVGPSGEDYVGDGGGQIPPIWCIDYLDNLIVIGCANGRIEFWEGSTGKLKVF